MAETTTIQIDVKMLKLLNNIKKEIGAKSYAEAIAWLAKRAKTVRHSERGAFPKLKTFEREKHDRFD